jgi:hypothetical protein
VTKKKKNKKRRRRRKKSVHRISKTPGDTFRVAAIVNTTDVRTQ